MIVICSYHINVPAIEQAKALATDLGINARFIESNIYDLPTNLSGEFEVVFTSYGSVYWLPDISAWGRIAASFVKPGGFFYMVDQHPMSASLYGEPYFNSGARASKDPGTYADPNARFENELEYGFQHTLGEIISALAGAGLHIDFLHEFPFMAWAGTATMTKGADGFYHKEAEGDVPLLFSLRASKPLRE